MNRNKGLLRRLKDGRRWLKRITLPVGEIDYGDLRRLDPIDGDWGFTRGLPVDRYYIESFLKAHATDIRGRTMEVANSRYTTKFGGDRVTRSDVLHDQPGRPTATLVADLASGEGLPSDAFDCVICTQTLHLIFNLDGAIGTLYRILKPGGVLLATLPGISQISPQDMARTGDFWRVSTAATIQLFSPLFGEDHIDVACYGSVLTAVCFLHGIASEELTQEELDHTDERYQVIVSVRAVK